MRRVPGLYDPGKRSAHLGDRASCRSEVEEDRCGISTDDNVIGGDVPMEKALGVHHLQGIEQRRCNPIQFRLCRLVAEALQPSLERFSRLEVHEAIFESSSVR